jgi:pyruvate-ferredoxin/flavodoxin oxidoreductase
VLAAAEAIAAIKSAVEKSYGRRGRGSWSATSAAIDAALAALHAGGPRAGGDRDDACKFARAPPVADDDSFVDRVTRRIMAGEGDLIPVSELPVDGSFPVGTAALEKRNLAWRFPVWDAALCTQCGKCALVCPHAAIRSKVFPGGGGPARRRTFKAVPVRSKDYPEGLLMTYQVAPEDCTGCTLCVDICPIRDKSNASHKALNMAPQTTSAEAERGTGRFFRAVCPSTRAGT